MAVVHAVRPDARPVRPRCLARFRCLGGDCPDTCCGGWGVEVDRETRRRWRTLADARWRRRLRDALVRRPDGRTVLRLDARGRCVLHADDGLCELHRRFGPARLPLLCRLFPRRPLRMGGVVLENFSLACPEMVRLLLEDPDALADADRPVPLLPRAEDSAPGAFDPLERLIVRDVTLRILTAHARPWAARLALLRVFLDDLRGTRERGGSVPAVAREVEAVLALLDGDSAAGAVPSDPRAALRVLVPLTAAFVRLVRETLHHDPERTEGLVERVLALRAGEDPARLAARAAEGIRGHLAALFATRPHLPGNLLGGLLLQQGLPPADPEGMEVLLWEAGLVFALWRMLLALSPPEGELPAVAVELAYRLVRRTLHHRDWLPELRAELARRGGLRAADWLALLA